MRAVPCSGTFLRLHLQNMFFGAGTLQSRGDTSCNAFNVNKKYNNRVFGLPSTALVFRFTTNAPKHAGAVTRVTQRMRYYIPPFLGHYNLTCK